VAGVIALVFPEYAATALVVIIAAWAIVTGVFQVWTAVRLRRVIDGEVWLGLAGIASVLFGVILLVFPRAGALSLVWLIGSGAIVFGVLLALLGWRLRRINEMAKIDAAHVYGRQ
jgi:uncharacterized membrane protein HdeD (DUF308 family)